MPATKYSSNDHFTEQDREDVKRVLAEIVDRALDEFSDETSFATMYAGWKRMIVVAATVGDEAFTQGPRDAELLAASKRILGSGRFDLYE
jgi:hypothetical protein